MMQLDDPQRERILDMELVRENQYNKIHKMRMILLLEMNWFALGGIPDFCKNLHKELMEVEEQLAKELEGIRKLLWENLNE